MNSDPAETPRRLHLAVDLPHTDASVQNDLRHLRHPEATDAPDLGVLMWHAYRGTPDAADAGDSSESAIAEIRRTFDGAYGAFLPEASFVAGDETDPSGIVAAALTTLWLDGPLLAFVFTAPTHVGRGMAQRLIDAVMRALTTQGYSSLHLAVSETNARARRLYQAIGFSEV